MALGKTILLFLSIVMGPSIQAADIAPSNFCTQNPEGARIMMDELLIQSECQESGNLMDCEALAGLKTFAPIVGGVAAAGAMRAALGATSNRRNVRSLADFRRHTSLHVQRLKVLAKEALTKFPDEFPGLTQEMADDVIPHHDEGKLNEALSKKKKLLVFRTQSILERLYKFYGIPKSSLSPAQRQKMMALIGELNALDDEITKFHLERIGLITPEGKVTEGAKSYLRLEKIVDSVDRIENPISKEEYAAPKTPINDTVKKPSDQKIGEHLQKNYKKLTVGFEYSRPPTATLGQKGKAIAAALAEQKRLMSQGLAELIASRLTMRTAAAFVAMGNPAIAGAMTVKESIAPIDIACGEGDEVIFFDVDQDANSCRPLLELKPRFVNFLLEDPEVRQQKLGNPHLCGTLVAMNNKFRNPEWKVECGVTPNEFNVHSPKSDFAVQVKDGNIESIVRVPRIGDISQVRGFRYTEGQLSGVCLPRTQKPFCTGVVNVYRDDVGDLAYASGFDPKAVANRRFVEEAKALDEHVRQFSYLFLESKNCCSGSPITPNRCDTMKSNSSAAGSGTKI